MSSETCGPTLVSQLIKEKRAALLERSRRSKRANRPLRKSDKLLLHDLEILEQIVDEMLAEEGGAKEDNR